MNIRPQTAEMLKKFLSELLQEIGRMYAVASPVIILHLIDVFEVMKNTGEFSIDWRYIVAISALAILKGTDRALHESGISEKGIVRF